LAYFLDREYMYLWELVLFWVYISACSVRFNFSTYICIYLHSAPIWVLDSVSLFSRMSRAVSSEFHLLWFIQSTSATFHTTTQTQVAFII